MTKWRSVRVEQELLTAVKRTLETGRYRSLSEFVSEAIQLRLNELKQTCKKPRERQTGYSVIQERLLCSPNHMWAMVTSEGTIRVGLSDYAQTHLKGIVRIQTEPIGHEVNREKLFGLVETWMFRFDLYTPVSGKIIKINEAIKDKPSTIYEDPYGAGWIAEIKCNNLVTLEGELRDLMGPLQYKMWAIKQRHFARAKLQAPK